VVAPLGVEAPRPALVPIPTTGTVFGTAGRMAHGGSRKGLNEVMAAFVAAFPDPDLPVRLDVKCWPDCLPRLVVPDDPRIRVITDAWTAHDLGAWYDGLTCYVTASRGEGYGLPPLEAMAHG